MPLPVPGLLLPELVELELPVPPDVGPELPGVPLAEGLVDPPRVPALAWLPVVEPVGVDDEPRPAEPEFPRSAIMLPDDTISRVAELRLVPWSIAIRLSCSPCPP